MVLLTQSLKKAIHHILSKGGKKKYLVSENRENFSVYSKPLPLSNDASTAVGASIEAALTSTTGGKGVQKIIQKGMIDLKNIE